jgi:hypothetical protein
MRDIKQDLIDTLKPIMDCKVHNPNRSDKQTTSRTINPKACDLAALRLIYIQLQKAEAIHYLPALENRVGTNIDTEA